MEEELNVKMEEKPSAKKRLQFRAKKYLVYFIILMVLCTFISRATASVTTPMVSYENPKRGSLTYKIQGTGTVVASQEIYIPVEENMKIDEVYVKEGDIVEKGDSLFSYDLEDLKERIKEAKKELKSSQTDYEKQVLQESLLTDESSNDSAVKSYERAKEDYQQAKENLQEAKEEYEEKVQKIYDDLDETKQTEYDTAYATYETALESYNDTNDTYEDAYNAAVEAISTAQKARDKAVEEAVEQVTEAKESLEDIQEQAGELEELIQEYAVCAKNNDAMGCSSALEKICIEYFGEETYDSLVSALSSANDTYAEAVEAYEALEKEWAAKLEAAASTMSGMTQGSAEYNSAYEAYQELVIQRDQELASANRAVNSASATVSKTSKKYVAIKDAATAYRLSYITVNSGNPEDRYLEFYNTVLDDTILRSDDVADANKLISKKEKNLTEVTSDQDALVQEAKSEADRAKATWEKMLAKAQKSVDKADEELQKLVSKVYSADDSIETAWSTVESMQDAVDAAKRTLEDAKEDLADSNESLAIAAENEEIQDRIDAMNLESLEETIAEKEEVVQELQDAYDAGGVVVSTLDGTITTIEVTRKATTSGSEKVTVTPNSNTFTGSFGKDDLKYMKEGETIQCTLATEKEAIEAEISNIRYNSSNSNYDFDAILPEGDFQPNVTGSYVYTEQTDKYENTIPVSALRSASDNTYYVLVISTTETILGTEMIADRVNVEVEGMDSTTAAVTNVYSDMQIITGSSRNISEGDRVRIGDYE